ncbi:MAG TPA: nuclear transport factor 2 family protein [Pyrinomonadaceae bacterium]|nr:nuclear transport factor 2 family protein [Pyrinomonadaceae bacterium]
MKSPTLLLLFVVCAGVAHAQTRPPVDLEKEKAELLRLHREAREAHFKTDPARLQEGSAEEFVYVRDGRIGRVSRADQVKRYEGYFKGAKYFEWDDVEEPIVSVSQDGSMAWMITRIRVRRTQKDAAGKEQEEKFVYAGIMTYEKRDGKWIRVANVSTFEPPN